MFSNIAKAFSKQPLQFNIPEGLKLIEEISKRYRALLKSSIPFCEQIKVTQIYSGYNLYQKHGENAITGFKLALMANDIRKLLTQTDRFVLDKIKEKSDPKKLALKTILKKMEYNSKLALLEECATVAIDLYSGRLNIEDEDIQPSKIASHDIQFQATELEPIRIVLVGQTGCGKSSLVNVLMEDLLAEVDILPSTNQATIHKSLLDDSELTAVDLPGMDGDQKTSQAMLSEMTQADLVIWLLKANQSARKLDIELHEEFESFYQKPENISKKKPTLIGVVNQVDKLKPLSEWTPPYQLDIPQNSKARTIAQALEYNQNKLSPDLILPLSIAKDKIHFGVENLKSAIENNLLNAKNTQKNRQRIEATNRGTPFYQQGIRLFGLGKQLVKKTYHS